MNGDNRERLVGAIMARAQPELLRRREGLEREGPVDEARERLVRSIMARSQTDLERRRARSRMPAATVLTLVQEWSRGLAAAAAAVALIAAGTMAWFGMDAQPAQAQVPTLAEALTPGTIADWLLSGEQPAVPDLWLDLGTTSATPAVR